MKIDHQVLASLDRHLRDKFKNIPFDSWTDK